MTTCKRGDIVLVPFPFTDLSTMKQRPALVLSADNWNVAQSDVVLVGVTSQPASFAEPGSIILSPADLIAGGLPKPSRIRTTKLFTIHQGLLKRTLGRLPDATTAAVLAEVRRFFS